MTVIVGRCVGGLVCDLMTVVASLCTDVVSSDFVVTAHRTARSERRWRCEEQRAFRLAQGWSMLCGR